MSTPLVSAPERIDSAQARLDAIPHQLKPGDRADCHSSGQVEARIRLIKVSPSEFIPSLYLDLCGHCFHVQEFALVAGDWTVLQDNR